MPGRFYTYITIEDVAHKETGRKAALRKFVFLLCYIYSKKKGPEKGSFFVFATKTYPFMRRIQTLFIHILGGIYYEKDYCIGINGYYRISRI